jgi:ribosomal protein S18 acetylase RimI-like enzyme
MRGEIVIRSYRAADRDPVRMIAHQTGYMGEPADWFWRDATSFADIWTSYYTDCEPESAFVAKQAGHVLGYLLGCVDSAHAPNPAVTLARQVARRLVFLRPGTAGFLWRSVWDLGRQRHAPTGVLTDPRWPSHLHINLLPQARGCGAGSRLMNAWFARLRDAASPGCHLATLAENTPAIAFFERTGFRRHGTAVLVPGMRLRSGGRMHLQLMVRESSL